MSQQKMTEMFQRKKAVRLTALALNSTKDHLLVHVVELYKSSCHTNAHQHFCTRLCFDPVSRLTAEVTDELTK